MRNNRIVLVVLLALAGVTAHAQLWMGAYEKGLKAARAEDWVGARAAFQEAIAYRPEDASGPTTLPGPVADRRQWRSGSPYSPNFLAAYAEYRIGNSATNLDDGRPALVTAATEFETLLTKGQASRETFFFLNQIYTKLGDTAKRQDLESRYASSKPNFRVDTEVLAPEELTLISGTPQNPKKGTGPQITIQRPGESPTAIPGGPSTAPGTGIAPAVGPVPTVATKYALVIGNSSTQLKQGSVKYGADDAQAIREALVTHAGYPEANVDLVLNTTSAQLLASAKALADRVPEGATIFIFFAGNGVNIDGKDYLAGVDSSSETDAGTMVGKMDLLRPFIAKDGHIFAFFETPRPITSGNYFGKEVPLVGRLAQVQSTIPGDGINSVIRNGQEMGVFTEAIVSSLQEIRSNRIPIGEFGWQVFNKSRGGGSSSPSGNGRQVPTIPVRTHMSEDDRF